MLRNPSIVLRKIAGRFDAAFAGRHGPGQPITVAGPSRLSSISAIFAFLALAVLLIAVMIHAPHHASTLFLAGPIVAKDGRAAEFRTKAQQIREELLDLNKQLTKDEVEARAKDIQALEARAALVAEFTPDAEVDRQGGDDALKRVNPDSDEAATEVRDFQGEMEKIAKRVRREFGGANGYVLALARRTIEPLTGKRAKIHAEINDLQKRAIIGTAGDVSGGEFLLPLQQVNSIFQLPNEQVGLVQHATRYPVSGRTLRIPMLDQTTTKRTDGTLIDRPMAGIANVSIIGEGDTKPEREPSFVQRLLTVYKVAAYTELGDETLSDDFTGDLAPTVQRSIGGQCMNYINELTTIDGNGTAMPLGGLNDSNGSLLAVERATKGTITTDDVFNMFAKHTFGGGQSFWLIHRTAIPKLFALKLSGNTLVTFINNLQGVPQMSLLGLPIYMTDLTSQVGSKGDLALLNGGFYALALRQALTVESSIHYKFRNDLTAYRFITRAGGIPIPTDTYTYKAVGAGTTSHPMQKVAEHSPFVVLDHTAVAS